MPSLSISFPALIAVTFSVLSRLPGCNSQPFELIPMDRPEDPLTRNTVQFQCHNQDPSNSGSLPVEDTMFWVDNTDRNLRDLLGEGGFSIIGGDTFLFTITRELEGRYFCGPNTAQTSPMVQLVAYPVSSEIISEITVRVQEGSDAILPPLISPGALRDELYFIDWRRNATFVTLARIEGPRMPTTISMDQRYSVNQETFALTIQSINFEDRGVYLGILGVQDPGGREFEYTKLRMVGVTLDVYVPPTFLESPRDITVSTVDTQSVSFTCKVQAYPRPTITWYHEIQEGNEKEITTREIEKYIISEVDSREDNLYNVTSTLLISNLRSVDSGRMRCVAAISVQAESQPLPASQSADLSVLGHVKTITTFVTLQNGTIFRLFLFRPMRALVQLYIQYTDVESGNTMNETTTSQYAQSEEIVFFIENIPEMFKKFRIDVALVSGDLQGPLLNDSTIHDLSQPTDLEATLVRYLAPSICGVLVAVIFAIVVIVALCIKCCSENCLPFCFSRNSDAKQARFIEKNLPGDNNTLEHWKNLLERAEKVLTEMPTHLESGVGGSRPEGGQTTVDKDSARPAGGPPPPRKERKCRNFCSCVRDTEIDKKAKENYEELERLLDRIDPSSLTSPVVGASMNGACGRNMTDTGRSGVAVRRSNEYELRGFETKL